METQENKNICYADAYLRLSREDGDKAESDSIGNQRDLILAFIENHPEIVLRSVRVDDGYTGVNFERPAFISMMEAVKNKEINCIIVKDFSRLGRNFIETGKYIEKVFPFMGVRFISINDNYDSAQPKTASDDLIVPVKNLMNDAYCRDISIKIRSQLDIKRKKGECIAPFAVFGYLKDPEQKNKLIVDEFAASIVQDIFNLKLGGLSAQAIADRFNDQGILSPMEYKRFIGSNYTSTFKRNAKATWTAVAILRILKNPVYIGTLVQGKRSSPNYKVKKRFDMPKDKWISISKNHEPIISTDTFENVAKILLSDTRTSPTEDTVFSLAGLIYCGDCGSSMIRKNNASTAKPYYYYICSGYKKRNGCNSHSIRDVLLERAVLAALQEHIHSVWNVEHTLQSIKNLPYTSRQVRKSDERLNAKRSEIEKFQENKSKLHEDYADGILSREDYVAFGKRYEKKISEAENAVFKLEQEIDKLVNGNAEEQQWITYFKQYENIEELSRKLAVELIDRIFVYENQKIRIEFKFQNEYERVMSFLNAFENTHPATPQSSKQGVR